MKKIVFLFFLIVPFIVKADTIESISEKYYKTIEVKPTNGTDNLRISKTYEISKEEYDLGLEEPQRNNAVVETTYKKMTVSIASSQSLYKYKVKLHWKNIPSTRSYDIIGLAYLTSVEPKLSPIFEQEYCYSSGSCHTSTSHYPKEETSSVSAVFALPTGSLSSLDQTLFVVVGKKNPNSTIVYQKAVGDYAHATQAVGLGNALNHYSMNTSGLSLDSIISSYYDEISAGVATWYGTW